MREMDSSALYDLTPGQLLIWLGMQRHPDAPIYNTVSTFRIAASLDPDAFETAFRSLVDASDALRSVFLDVDGAPQCAVLDPDDAPLVQRVDLSDESDVEAALATWVAERGRRRLPVEQCVFDAALIRTRADETVWYLNQHHLVADAWSTRVVYEQVAERYAALTGDQPLPLGCAPSRWSA